MNDLNGNEKHAELPSRTHTRASVAWTTPAAWQAPGWGGASPSDERQSGPACGAPGDHFNGIHEVTGSIPVSSTNSDNNLAMTPGWPGRLGAALGHVVSSRGPTPCCAPLSPATRG